MPYRMTAGGALRIRRFDEPGDPELTKVSAQVAKRSEFVRLQFMNAAEDDGELVCAVFRDGRTGEVYGQPVPDQEGV